MYIYVADPDQLAYQLYRTLVAIFRKEFTEFIVMYLVEVFRYINVYDSGRALSSVSHDVEGKVAATPRAEAYRGVEEYLLQNGFQK